MFSVTRLCLDFRRSAHHCPLSIVQVPSLVFSFISKIVSLCTDLGVWCSVDRKSALCPHIPSEDGTLISLGAARPQSKTVHGNRNHTTLQISVHRRYNIDCFCFLLSVSTYVLLRQQECSTLHVHNHSQSIAIMRRFQ